MSEAHELSTGVEVDPPRDRPVLPEGGPRVDPDRLRPRPPDGGAGDPSVGLLRLAPLGEALLAEVADAGMAAAEAADADAAAPLAPARLRRQVAAVRGLVGDAVGALAVADARLAEARAEAVEVVARAEAEVSRLWRRVSADVAARRSATDAFVARAQERAERDAARVVADARARADELLAHTGDLVASWLEEPTNDVAEPAEALPVGRGLGAPPPAPLARRGLWRRLLRRRARRR
jgi:hypothetical protein